MKRSVKPFITTCILFFYLFGAKAQDTRSINYYQPVQDVFQTELVYPQEKNEVQLTFYPAFRNNSQTDQLNLPLLLEYGLTDRWQIELSWNVFQSRFPANGHPVSRIGNLEVGTQYSFMNINNSRFHAALGMEVEIPLNNPKGYEESQWEYEPYISLALDLPSLNHAQLFAQTGIGFIQNKTEDEETEGNELQVNGGFFVPFNKIVLTSELSWWTNKWDGGEENQLYLTPGAIFNLPGSWETGLGIPVGLNKQSDKFMILAILTFEFGLTKENE